MKKSRHKPSSIFIAGTDTGVGKTVIAGAFASALRLKGLDVGVMKPVACGGREDAHFLLRCAGASDAIKDVNPIFLKAPLSPNVAADIERVRIDVKKISKAHDRLKKKHDIVIIEGCGGLLVPMTDRFWVIDLIPLLKADTILVSRAGLGAINHSLLSLEALRHRRIRPLGIIFNRLNPGPLSTPEKTNPRVVSRLGKTQSLGVFPYFKSPEKCTEDCLGKAFLKHCNLHLSQTPISTGLISARGDGGGAPHSARRRAEGHAEDEWGYRRQDPEPQ